MSCVDSAIIKALVEHVGMDPDGVPLGTPITGEAPISVSEDKKVSIAIDNNTMEVKDGKLAVLSDTMVTTAGTRHNFTYSISGGKFIISGAQQGLIHAGDILITPKNKYVIAPSDTLLTATSDDYAIIDCASGYKTTLKWNADDSTYSISYSDFLNTTITDKHGIFTRRLSGNTSPTPVIPANELILLIENLVAMI